MTSEDTYRQAEYDLQRLRVDLRGQLAMRRKNSLYSVLGVPADSSDAELAEVIGGLKGVDQPLDAETRYAVETLGDAAARGQFDRRLMEQLKSRPATSARMDQAWEPAHAALADGGMNVLLVAIVLLGAGYLGLVYMKDKSERELRLKESEIRSEDIRLKAEISDRVVANQKVALEASIAAQERAAELPTGSCWRHACVTTRPGLNRPTARSSRRHRRSNTASRWNSPGFWQTRVAATRKSPTRPGPSASRRSRTPSHGAITPRPSGCATSCNDAGRRPATGVTTAANRCRGLAGPIARGVIG